MRAQAPLKRHGGCRRALIELAQDLLYRVPKILTLGRFPDARESDSTWRTQVVRHVGSDTIAPRFWCVPAAWFGEEDERRPSGPSASGARRNFPHDREWADSCSPRRGALVV